MESSQTLKDEAVLDLTAAASQTSSTWLCLEMTVLF